MLCLCPQSIHVWRGGISAAVMNSFDLLLLFVSVKKDTLVMVELMAAAVQISMNVPKAVTTAKKTAQQFVLTLKDLSCVNAMPDTAIFKVMGPTQRCKFVLIAMSVLSRLTFATV